MNKIPLKRLLLGLLPVAVISCSSVSNNVSSTPVVIPVDAQKSLDMQTQAHPSVARKFTLPLAETGSKKRGPASVASAKRLPVNRPAKFVPSAPKRSAVADKFKKRAAVNYYRRQMSTLPKVEERDKRASDVYGVPRSLALSSSKKSQAKYAAQNVKSAETVSSSGSSDKKSFATAAAVGTNGGWRFYRTNILFGPSQYLNDLDQTVYTYYANYNADYITVHFDYIDLESGRDYVTIYDEDGICAYYTGSYENLISTMCNGNYVQIVVETDSSVSGGSYDGFYIKGFNEWVAANPVNNTPPVSVAKSNVYSNRVGEYFYFSGSDSFDSNGDRITYEWNFGNGQTSTNPTASVYYSTPGTYFVQLRVRDEYGATSTDSFTVYVSENPPSASFSIKSKKIATSNLAVIYIGSTAATGVTVDWGDTTSTTINPYTSAASTISHKYNTAGIYTILVRASNAGGMTTAMDTIEVTGIAQPPEFALSSMTAQGSSHTLDSRYSIRDDGNLQGLSISYGGGSQILNPTKNLTSGDLQSYFSRGLYSVTQSFTYQRLVQNAPKPYAGTYAIQATVRDSDNFERTVNYTFSTKNEAPVLNTSAAKFECQSLNCTASLGTATIPFASAAYDTDGDVIETRWEFLQQDQVTLVPSCPVILNSATASCVLPAAGKFYARFKVTDNLGLYTYHSMLMTVTNKAPVVSVAGMQKICTSLACQLQISKAPTPYTKYVYDTDGSITSYSWEILAADQTTPVGSCSAGSNVTTVNCVFPAAGNYYIRLAATDDVGATTRSAAVKLAVKNALPVIKPAALVRTCKSLDCQFKMGSVSTPFAKAVYDTDGSISSYSWEFVGADKVTPVPGCAGVSNVDTASCVFPQDGTYYIKFKATDNYGLTQQSLITVAMKNKLPVITAAGVTKVCQGFSCNYVIGNVTKPFEKFVYDPDGLVTDYQWEFYMANKATPIPGCGTVVNSPTASCTYPGKGTYYIRIKATDNSGAVGSTLITVKQ